jgi:hypothetical protein
MFGLTDTLSLILLLIDQVVILILCQKIHQDEDTGIQDGNWDTAADLLSSVNQGLC